MTLFIKTFRDLLKWKSLTISLIIMAILPTILGFVLKYEIYGRGLSYKSQLDFTVGIYYILVFMWVLGIPFLIMTTSKGIGVLANDITDGTLALLVSMRISRYQIILYKWLAYYLVIIILGIIGIYENLAILTFISDMDTNIQNQLMQSIPNLIQYLLLMGFIFSNIALLLSLLMKSKIIATVSTTFLIIFIFLIIPLFKTFLMSYYEDYYLYYFDINYQFSSIYYYFIGKSNVEFTPVIQMIIGTFLGIFDTTKIMDPDLSFPLLKSAEPLKYISVKNIMYFWSGLGLVSMITSIVILTKRDIT